MDTEAKLWMLSKEIYATCDIIGTNIFVAVKQVSLCVPQSGSSTGQGG
jgi:uncharacterized membrane protein YeiH